MSFTYYTSLTGMLAASFGLQNTSHNVANLQSPGFKRKEIFYSSLGDNKHNNFYAGVVVGGTHTNFNPGNYLETSNPTDFAIVGQGFFIVRLKNNELVYTRDGEFSWNKEGFLIDKQSGGLVQGYDAQANLVPINQFGSKTLTGKKTTLIDVKGEFILVEKKEKNDLDPDPRKSAYEPVKFSLANIFDDQGKAHSLELEFKPLGSISSQQKDWDGLEWELTQLSYDKNELNFVSQSLRFSRQEDGAPEEGSNQINLKLPLNQTLTLKFGSYISDQDKAVRLNKETPAKINSSLEIYQQDGYAAGQQIDFSFDENGQIFYHYDNNQSIAGIYLALAKFTDLEHSLLAASPNCFRAKNLYDRQIGRANQGGFGAIQPKKLESSNVDSTTEFAHIVILQRMFQACSQIMEIDKQLVEELIKK